MIYRDGDVEEGLWKNGRIYHPTRYKPQKSLIKTSYAYRFGIIAKIDIHNNVIVHPLTTGTPSLRLVISPDGQRYKGELDCRLQMHGRGILYLDNGPGGSEFRGEFNSERRTGTGYIH